MATLVHESTLTGVRKAAILTLLLGEDASAEVFKHLSEDEIEMIAARGGAARPGARATIGERRARGVPPDVDGRRVRHHAATSTTRRSCWSSRSGPTWPAHARSRHQVVRVDRWLHSLEKADPQQLSKFILGEHPQTIALILAHLKPGQRRAADRRCCPRSCAPTC